MCSKNVQFLARLFLTKQLYEPQIRKSNPAYARIACYWIVFWKLYAIEIKRLLDKAIMDILEQGPKVLLFSAFFVNFGFESALKLHHLPGWTIFLRVVVQNDIFHLGP